MSDDELKAPAGVLLSGVVGSTAYGLATEDSDVDRLGLFAAPTEKLLGLHPVQQSIVSSKPDATWHEAGKMAMLLLKGNPTATEICWLSAYEVTTPEGEALIGIRSAFLSAKATRDAYFGYATQQMTRIRNRGDGSFSADTRKRTAKHARHLQRLLYQGCELHRTGGLTVRLSPDEAVACRLFGERVAAGEMNLAEKALRDAEDVFNRPGVLPARPDEVKVEAWLQDVRAAFYARETR